MNSGSNSVLVYHGTGVSASGVLTFAATPTVYPVGDDPVSVTVADVTGRTNNGVPIPDLLVVDQGSNDVYELVGSIVSGQWQGTPGPRLSSGGGTVGVNVVADSNSPGGFDLVVTNGQSGTVALLPGRSQGFFLDQNPVSMSLGTRLTQAPVVNGSIAVSTTPDGQLVGFNLETFTNLGILFTPPPGQGVDAVTTAGGNFFVAEQGGIVEEFNAGFDAVETFSPLNGTPQTPSAIDVLADGEILVTNQGEDTIFVYGLGGVIAQGTGGQELAFGQTLVQALEPATPGSHPTFTAPADAPLVLVVTLVAEPLSTGEASVELGAVVGQGVLAQLSQQPFQDQVGGNEGEGEAIAVAGMLTAKPGFIPAVDPTLRQLDEDTPVPIPDPLAPLARAREDLPAPLATAFAAVEPEPRIQVALRDTLFVEDSAQHEGASTDSGERGVSTGERGVSTPCLADNRGLTPPARQNPLTHPRPDAWWLVLPILAAVERSRPIARRGQRPVPGQETSDAR